jgi:hypothetical protein
MSTRELYFSLSLQSLDGATTVTLTKYEGVDEVSVINWSPVGDWMGFPYLTKWDGLTHAYTLTYKLTDNTSEPWTSRHIRFKGQERAALYGAAKLMVAAVPELIKAVGVDVKDTAFVAALSSGETSANPQRAIPLIAAGCAERVGAKCENGALSKKAHNKIHNFFKADERDAELDKAEYQSKKLDATNVFVFDDFITRGATLSKIATAIQAVNPNAKVYGVALAKAERVDWCPNPTNDQVPDRWNKLWEQGEQVGAGKAG